MITVASIDELPASVPPILVEAIGLAAEMHERLDKADMWGSQPAMVFRYKMLQGQLRIGYTDLSDGTGGSGMLDEDLRTLIYDRSPPPMRGRHLGTAAFAESIVFSDNEEGRRIWAKLSALQGKPLERAVKQAVRDGHARHQRVTMAAFTSGWKFEYTTERHERPEIEVVEPGEQIPLTETFQLLVRLEEKLSTRD